MRGILVVGIWIFFVGSLMLYMSQRAMVSVGDMEAGQPSPVDAASYALLVTPSFTVKPDPFALQMDDGAAAPALTVRMGTRVILKKTDEIAGGVSLRVAPLPLLVSGENEIYLEASPPLDEYHLSHAVRIQLIENGITLAEKTFWSQPGSKVAGTFRFKLHHDTTKDSSDAHS